MTTGPIELRQFVAWLARFRDLVVAKREYLTELDSAIGDADHGINMARGMTAVMERIGASPAGAADRLFSQVGMALLSSVGGASGPLYATFFMTLGKNLSKADPTPAADFALALHRALDDVVARGKAEPGDKTMVDAAGPALAALDKGIATGLPLTVVAKSTHAAAEAGRDATVPLLAKKGRASYLGDRSIGHLDPGATSVALLFQAFSDAVGRG